MNFSAPAPAPPVAIGPGAGVVVRGGFVLFKTFWKFKEEHTKKQDELRQKTLGSLFDEFGNHAVQTATNDPSTMGVDFPPMWYRDP